MRSVLQGMRIAICDDDKIINNMIEKYIKLSVNRLGIDESVTIEKIENAFQLYEYIDDARCQLDILFLDIVLGRDNGIELGEKLQERNKNIKIIFITGHINFVESIFKIEPFGLLLKPITEERVFRILLRAIKSLNENQGQYVIFKNRNGLTNVKLNDIMYVESRGRYLEIHFVHEEPLRVTMTMNEMEHMLSDSFIKCHRSYFFNIRKIRKLSKNYACVEGGKEIPVSMGNYKKVYDRLIQNLEE